MDSTGPPTSDYQGWEKLFRACSLSPSAKAWPWIVLVIVATLLFGLGLYFYATRV